MADLIAIDPSGLPEGARKLLHLAHAVPEKAGARRQEGSEPFFEKVGRNTRELGQDANKFFGFLGDATLSFARLLRGKAGFQRADLVMIMEECGSLALPIVSLISLLAGLILAFAAQLGTMQVNEEIDALRTFGIEPMDFLVLPRMLALMLMMPLLCLYADLLGIAGGAMGSEGNTDEPPIAVNNLTMAYGDFVLQHDLSFDIRRGDVFIIMGGSGCGKNTLLHHLIGL